MFRPALRLMGLFLAGAPAIWGDTLWYNGDATRPEFDANSVADPTGDVWIYDDFIVPAGDGAWQVTAVFSNDIFNNNNGPIPTQARWEIRTNISRGVSGNLVAGGIAPAVVNPTGRVFFGMIEYTVLVNVSVTLFPGTYWLSVAPVDPGVANQIAIFASISSTSGANCW